jgi:uncharacterized membrane protein
MFQFTNETNQNVWLAFAYFDESEKMFMSEGWWRIAPNSTIAPYVQPLRQRYYYYYAYQEDRTGEWSGDTKLNVSQFAAFTLREPAYCSESHDTRLFKKMDTGDYRTFLVRLTDTSSSPISEDEKQLLKLFIQEFKNK